jgi:hypothetical protein
VIRRSVPSQSGAEKGGDAIGDLLDYDLGDDVSIDQITLVEMDWIVYCVLQ